MAENNEKKSLEGTAGSNDPLYIMYWTNEDLLSLVAQSLVDPANLSVDGKDLLPLGPSSSIILEFTLDG